MLTLLLARLARLTRSGRHLLLVVDREEPEPVVGQIVVVAERLLGAQRLDARDRQPLGSLGRIPDPLNHGLGSRGGLLLEEGPGLPLRCLGCVGVGRIDRQIQ